MFNDWIFFYIKSFKKSNSENMKYEMILIRKKHTNTFYLENIEGVIRTKGYRFTPGFSITGIFYVKFNANRIDTM